MDLADELSFGGLDMGLSGVTAAMGVVGGSRRAELADSDDDSGSPGPRRKAKKADAGPKGKRRQRESTPAEKEADASNESFDAMAAKLRAVVASGGASSEGGGGGGSSKGTFAGMGLSQSMLSGINRMGYRLPTPIQRRTLPLTLGGRDVVAMARTGSGKTAAFLLPVLEKLGKHDSTAGGPRAIILSPTREIAQQTLRFARGLGRFTDLRCALLVGGDSLDAQFDALATAPDVLIATPGRLMHLLAEVRDLTLSRVEALVFDEADRLFELGFAEQLEAILSRCPAQRQTLLFSATLPRMLVQFARAGLRDPELVRLDVETKVSDKLRMAFLRVRSEEKEAALLWLLRTLLPKKQQAMVFTATRQHVELLSALLRSAGLTVEAIYGQMEPENRRMSILRFRQRRARVLVATDVAARGIDLPLLDNVINFNFPDRAKLFVHRCGRVARQGRGGCAFSIVSPPELAFMADVFSFLDRPMASSREQTDAANAAKEAELAAGFGGDVVHVDGAAAKPVGAGGSGLEATEGEEGDEEGSSSSSSSAAAVAAAEAAAASAASAAAGGIAYDPSSVAPAHIAATAAAIAAGRDGYRLSDMQPQDVHHGRIPRALLQGDVELVDRWNVGAGAMEVEELRKAARNSSKQYGKTRSSAMRSGIAAARGLEADACVHPLALGLGHTETVAQEAAAGTLAAYRPSTTVFELEGGRKAHEKRQQAAAAMKRLRRANYGRLRRDAAAAKTVDTAAAQQLGLLLAAAHANDEDDEAADQAGRAAAAAAAYDSDDDDTRAALRSAARETSAEAAALASGGALTAVPTSDVGPRMSAAERRKRKRAAKRGREEDDSATASSTTARAARRRALADATARMAELASRGGERRATLASTGAFRDKALYISATAGEAARATEAALDVHAGNRSSDGGLLNASSLEAHVLDLVGDDGKTMSANKRQLRWDARKKKYVRLTAAEWSERRGEKRTKLADGSVLRGDGKDHGDAYRRWTKKTKRRVGAVAEPDEVGGEGAVRAGGAPLVMSSADFRGGGKARQHALAVSLGATATQTKAAAAADTRRKQMEARGAAGHGDDEPMTEEEKSRLIKPGKAGGSGPARRELRTEVEVRKMRKKKDDDRLRSMPKDKRRVIVAQQRSDALKKRAARIFKKGPGKAKSLAIIRK